MSNATIGYAGLGTTFLGGLTSAIGDIFGGMSERQMYNYQSGVARLNQQIAQQNSSYALRVGDIQAMEAGMRGAQTYGAIVASQASHGLDVRSGSPGQVQASQRYISSLDQTAIRSNAAKLAYNYSVEATQAGAQAQIDTAAGRNAMAAGLIQADSSILGAATSVSSQWLRGQQVGIWGGNQPLGG